MGNSNFRALVVVDPEIHNGIHKSCPLAKRGGPNWGGFIDPLSTPVVKLSVKTRMRNHTSIHQVSAGILKFQDLKFEVWTLNSVNIQWWIVRAEWWFLKFAFLFRNSCVVFFFIFSSYGIDGDMNHISMIFHHTGIPITLGIHSMGESGFLECLWHFFLVYPSHRSGSLDRKIFHLDRRFVKPAKTQQIWRFFEANRFFFTARKISRPSVVWKKKLVQRRFATLHFEGGLGWCFGILTDLLTDLTCVPRRPLVASPKPSGCSRWACRRFFFGCQVSGWRVWGKVTEVKKVVFFS